MKENEFIIKNPSPKKTPGPDDFKINSTKHLLKK